MQSKRDHILRAAQEVLDRAERNMRDGVEPCKNCRHSRIGFLDRFCTHPIVKVAQMNTFDAFDREHLADCSEQRGTFGHYGPVVCGPDGELFEPKLTFWELLFGKGSSHG